MGIAMAEAVAKRKVKSLNWRLSSRLRPTADVQPAQGGHFRGRRGGTWGYRPDLAWSRYLQGLGHVDCCWSKRHGLQMEKSQYPRSDANNDVCRVCDSLQLL